MKMGKDGKNKERKEGRCGTGKVGTEQRENGYERKREERI